MHTTRLWNQTSITISHCNSPMQFLYLVVHFISFDDSFFSLLFLFLKRFIDSWLSKRERSAIIFAFHMHVWNEVGMSMKTVCPAGWEYWEASGTFKNYHYANVSYQLSISKSSMFSDWAHHTKNRAIVATPWKETQRTYHVHKTNQQII